MQRKRVRAVHEGAGHAPDGGLALDLSRVISRRRALQLLAAGGLATLAGCTGTSALSGSGSSSGTGVAEIPEETAGPFPGNGSNGANVLTESGVVRSDITSSFGGASAVAEGVPLSIELTVLDVAAGGAPVQGAAVYVWHCDREGRYSLYSDGVTGENYLRGLQPADASGETTFTSTFPGAYAGRWPHIHFEVYPSIDEATAAGSTLVTSQIALPQDICRLVYGSARYEQSAQNLAQTSLDTDMVFADGYSTQLAAAGGSVEDGILITLDIGV